MKTKSEKTELNNFVFSTIPKIIKDRSEMYRNYILIFYEMHIKPYLIYDSRNNIDMDFGHLCKFKGHSKIVAN